MTVEHHAESPLATYTDVLVRHSVPGQLDIAEEPFLTQVTVRVDPKSPAAERVGTALGGMLPHQPGEVVLAGDRTVLWMGPDEWLVVGPECSQQDVQDTVNAALDGEHGAVVDVSAHRTILSVTGPKTRELLNKGCALDLHPSAFRSNRCAQTVLARAGVVLACRDTEVPSFWVLVRSSFARHLADWLCDAAAEYHDGGGEP